MNLDPLFESFLRKHRILTAFKRNFTLNGTDLSEYERHGRDKTNGAIDAAFTWSRTLEGHEFWQLKHGAWLRYRKEAKAASRGPKSVSFLDYRPTA